MLAERDQETRRLFDSLAPEWEEMKQEILGSFDLNGEITKLLPATGTVADLGCGTGDLVKALAQKAKKVIGVDSSQEMIRASRSRFSRKNGIVEVRMGEFEHLPLRDCEADTAVCSMVLHHLPDPFQGIREVERVLKPKGRFIIADLDSHNSEIMRSGYGDRWLGFPEKTIENWLIKAGFCNIKIKQFPVKRNLTVLVISAEKK
ncbi:MAG: SAM-dependent methyltransferase [Spirochaetaceae bacterium]|nr:MAG: SAM-dependent methyltransferase [Spirochaetaceae bacterium]